MFELALEENKLDDIWEEVRAVAVSLEENPDFLPTIKHPDLSMEDRQKLISKIYSGKLSEDMMGFLDVLVRKNRIGDLEKILEYFDDRAKDVKQIGVVNVQTPVELSASEKEKVEARVLEVTDYASLEVNYTVDPALLGGMVIRIGDQILDNSIRSKLEAMSRNLQSVRLQA